MYRSQTQFTPIGKLPLGEDEAITALNAWKAMGQDCFAVGTSLGQMYLLRIDSTGAVEFAGPLEFQKVET